MSAEKKAQDATRASILETIEVIRNQQKEWLETMRRSEGALIGERLIVLDKHERAFSQVMQDGQTHIKLELPSSTLIGVSHMNAADAEKVKRHLETTLPEDAPYKIWDFELYAKDKAAQDGELIKRLQLALGEESVEKRVIHPLEAVSEQVLLAQGEKKEAQGGVVDFLMQDERAAWLEAGATDEDIDAIERVGGYTAILGNKDVQSRFQDMLDHCMQNRIVAVRNELRALGWDGERFDNLYKECDGKTLRFEQLPINIGAGANVVGVMYVAYDVKELMRVARAKVTPTLRIVDNMKVSAFDIANEFDAGVLGKDRTLSVETRVCHAEENPSP